MIQLLATTGSQSSVRPSLAPNNSFKPTAGVWLVYLQPLPAGGGLIQVLGASACKIQSHIFAHVIFRASPICPYAHWQLPAKNGLLVSRFGSRTTTAFTARKNLASKGRVVPVNRVASGPASVIIQRALSPNNSFNPTGGVGLVINNQLGPAAG